MNTSIRFLVHIAALVISVTAVLALVAINLDSQEYNLASIVAIALMLPVTCSLAFESWNEAKSKVAPYINA